MKEAVIQTLRQLQFTEYEAKAYLALLEESPLTGYAVSRRSGVPRSKIYEVLDTLVARGDAAVSRGDSPRYSPLAPSELVAQRRRRAGQVFAQAEQSLEQYAVDSHVRQDIWNIDGYHAIMDRVRQAVDAAARRVLLEVWPEDAPVLRDCLEAAAGRGVSVQVVAYGEVDLPFASVFPHDAGTDITREYGGRWIVCSADDREVVAGMVSLGEESRAAWTSHPGLVMPITEIIVHDLYIFEMMAAFRPQLEERFGPNLEKLRQRYSVAFRGDGYYVMPPK